MKQHFKGVNLLFPGKRNASTKKSGKLQLASRAPPKKKKLRSFLFVESPLFEERMLLAVVLLPLS